MTAAFETGPAKRLRLLERVEKMAGEEASHDKSKGVDTMRFDDGVIVGAFASGEWICWRVGGVGPRQGWRCGGHGWVKVTASEIVAAMSNVRGG